MKIQIKALPKSKNDTPIFDHCRKLIKDGVDPETLLEAYRGDTLCLSMKIKDGAALTVKDYKFKKYKPFPANRIGFL